MKHYDAIVIGARCAGSPTAMLLAQRGHRVLLVDKATFPSDTISSHFLQPPAVRRLQRWGLLDQAVASNCPPVNAYAFDFGPLTFVGRPAPIEGVATAYSPRRIVLDEILVRGAERAGAEVREGFTVEELLVEDGQVVGVRGRGRGGQSVVERASVVIGADGKRSIVASTVDTEQYGDAPGPPCYYTYFSGLPAASIEFYIRPDGDRAFGGFPTNDGLTLIIMSWPLSEFKVNKSNVEGAFMDAIRLAPEYEQRVREATREMQFFGMRDLPGYFRKPYGRGWALVGDAGYHKHPVTAYGITDAFRDAELLAAALDDAWCERRPLDQALADYQSMRDADSGAPYALTCEFASMAPPTPDLLALIAQCSSSQAAADQFVSVLARTAPAEIASAPVGGSSPG